MTTSRPRSATRSWSAARKTYRLLTFTYPSLVLSNFLEMNEHNQSVYEEELLKGQQRHARFYALTRTSLVGVTTPTSTTQPAGWFGRLWPWLRVAFNATLAAMFSIAFLFAIIQGWVIRLPPDRADHLVILLFQTFMMSLMGGADMMALNAGEIVDIQSAWCNALGAAEKANKKSFHS